jgi:hypothetical protein
VDQPVFPPANDNVSNDAFAIRSTGSEWFLADFGLSPGGNRGVAHTHIEKLSTLSANEPFVVRLRSLELLTPGGKNPVAFRFQANNNLVTELFLQHSAKLCKRDFPGQPDSFPHPVPNQVLHSAFPIGSACV